MKKSVVMIGCIVPAAAMAMADSTPPVYGRPTLYGEYEISDNDRRRAGAIYGVVPQNAAEKMPVKAKKPMPKNITKKKKKQNRAALKKVAVSQKSSVPSVDDIIVIPPRDVVDTAPIVPEKKEVRPVDTAVVIASAATAEVAPDIESFCVRRRPHHRGKLPDGIILMPGRPDLMSCIDK